MSTNAGVSLTLPVLWSDLDALGHVNNARFFTWFESARIALFERIGVVTQGAMTVGPILATTTCDFLRPVRFPADVRVTARISRVGETSLTMEYEIRDAATETQHAGGTSVAVLIDYRSSEKVRVPDDVRQAIDALGAR
jgi:acyl-CoA thioester hydrolase